MAGLWRKNPATPEGKYPIVLRRDGTPLDVRFIVITLRDPAAPAALEAYANKSAELHRDPQFVQDFHELAKEAATECQAIGPGDADAPPHRKDDPAILAWARNLGCPGA